MPSKLVQKARDKYYHNFLPRFHGYLLDRNSGVDACRQCNRISVNKSALRDFVHDELLSDGIIVRKLDKGRIEVVLSTYLNGLLWTCNLYFNRVDNKESECCKSDGIGDKVVVFDTLKEHSPHDKTAFLTTPAINDTRRTSGRTVIKKETEDDIKPARKIRQVKKKSGETDDEVERMLREGSAPKRRKMGRPRNASRERMQKERLRLAEMAREARRKEKEENGLSAVEEDDESSESESESESESDEESELELIRAVPAADAEKERAARREKRASLGTIKNENDSAAKTTRSGRRTLSFPGAGMTGLTSDAPRQTKRTYKTRKRPSQAAVEGSSDGESGAEMSYPGVQKGHNAKRRKSNRGEAKQTNVKINSIEALNQLPLPATLEDALEARKATERHLKLLNGHIEKLRKQRQAEEIERAVQMALRAHQPAIQQNGQQMSARQNPQVAGPSAQLATVAQAPSSSKSTARGEASARVIEPSEARAGRPRGTSPAGSSSLSDPFPGSPHEDTRDTNEEIVDLTGNDTRNSPTKPAKLRSAPLSPRGSPSPDVSDVEPLTTESRQRQIYSFGAM